MQGQAERGVQVASAGPAGHGLPHDRDRRRRLLLAAKQPRQQQRHLRFVGELRHALLERRARLGGTLHLDVEVGEQLPAERVGRFVRGQLDDLAEQFFGLREPALALQRHVHPRILGAQGKFALRRHAPLPG